MFRRKTLLMIIVLIFSLLTYFVTYEDAEKEKNRIIDRNLIHTRDIAQDIDQFLETKFLLMDVIAGSLTDYRGAPDYNLDEHLSSVLKRDKDLDSFVVVNEEGKVLIENHKSLDRQERQQLFNNYLLPYLQYPLKGARYTSDLIHSDLINAELVVLGTPLLKSGQIKGAVFLTLKSEAFARLLGEIKVGESGYVCLRDSAGEIIFHPRLKEIRTRNYKFLDIPLFPKTTYKINVSSFDHCKKYMTYKPLHNADWMVFILQPVSEYKAPIYTIWLKNGSLLALLFIFMYLLYILEQKEKGLLQTKLNNERLEVIAEFAAGLAHEIKNPLVPIKGFIQLEKRKPASTLGQENVRLLLNEVERIEKIIDDFMSLAQENLTEYTKINFSHLLKDTISFFKAEAGKEKLDVASNIESFTEDFWVLGDRKQLRQVFFNIIKNAVEAAGCHGNIQVDIGKVTNKEIQIQIKDTGQGIPSKILNKIGTPFFSTKEEGIGMGVAISQRILKNHGGRMEISSREGKGTIVIVFLPLLK
ncbi:MAG: ATP-binding protein [Peptococcaceae bacterium]